MSEAFQTFANEVGKGFVPEVETKQGAILRIGNFMTRWWGALVKVIVLAVLLVLAYLAITPHRLDSFELRDYTDQEIIKAVDETTMLGQMARGTWEWTEDPVDFP